MSLYQRTRAFQNPILKGQRKPKPKPNSKKQVRRCRPVHLPNSPSLFPLVISSSSSFSLRTSLSSANPTSQNIRSVHASLSLSRILYIYFYISLCAPLYYNIQDIICKFTNFWVFSFGVLLGINSVLGLLETNSIVNQKYNRTLCLVYPILLIYLFIKLAYHSQSRSLSRVRLGFQGVGFSYFFILLGWCYRVRGFVLFCFVFLFFYKKISGLFWAK